jgi:glycosyltransferase involved in cell wall biosynthesis
MNAALEKVGVYCEVACLDDPQDAYLGSDPFPVHALGPAKNIWRYSAKLLPWLEKHIDRFDVVIIHGLWVFPSFATWFIARKRRGQVTASATRIKLFVMPHGMLDPWFQKARGRELKAVRNWLYWKLIEHRIINDADGILFTCETERTLARQPFRPYRPKKEIVIRYGIESPDCRQEIMNAAFQQTCPGLAGQPYWLFLSRIHYKKGVDLLMKAYASLAETNVSLPKLVIAGPGIETTYGQFIQQLVASTPALHDQVFFPGMLSGNAKWGALYGCEAFILPSHQENFGIAVAEALACGKPVLLSDQVNIWREIVDGHAGLVDHDSVQGVRQLLDNWLHLCQEDKQRMGRQADELFHQQFEINSAAHSLLAAVSSGEVVSSH